MTDLTTTIDTYIAAWNEPAADRRRALVASTWADDGSYLEFKLRDYIMFHDGTKLDATAVKLSLERGKNLPSSAVAAAASPPGREAAPAVAASRSRASTSITAPSTFAVWRSG